MHKFEFVSVLISATQEEALRDFDFSVDWVIKIKEGFDPPPDV